MWGLVRLIMKNNCQATSDLFDRYDIKSYLFKKLVKKTATEMGAVVDMDLTVLGSFRGRA